MLSRAAGKHARPAFTLVELSVSVGILALMLALAAVVFKWTLDSTGQAKALTDINDRLRVMEQTLREDLRYVVPERSMMILQTNQVNAYWTQAGRAADSDANPLNGYAHPTDPQRENVYPMGDPNNPIGLNPGELLPPRADMLMFFTARPGSSFINPSYTSNLQQVVYGHADLGEVDSTGTMKIPAPYGMSIPLPGTFLPGIPPTTTYPVPAHDWHLARRAALISDFSINDFAFQFPGSGAYVAKWQNIPNGLNVTGLGADGSVAGSIDLLQGLVDVIPRTPPAFTNTVFDYTSQVVNLVPSGPAALVAGRNTPNWYARSRLDLTPPSIGVTNAPDAAVRRLGPYFLPNCASFKVEWTCLGRRGPANIPLQQMLWFDMQRPNPGGAGTGPFWDINPANPDALQGPNGAYTALAPQLTPLFGSLQDRFADPTFLVAPPTALDINATTPIWYASDPYPPAGTAAGPDLFFPTALKITVDVFDPNNRFARPVRHVMVLPVGHDGRLASN